LLRIFYTGSEHKVETLKHIVSCKALIRYLYYIKPMYTFYFICKIFSHFDHFAKYKLHEQ